MMIDTSAFYGQPGVTALGLQGGFETPAAPYGLPISLIGGPLAPPPLWGQFGNPLPPYGLLGHQGIGAAFALPQFVSRLGAGPFGNLLAPYGPPAIQPIALSQLMSQLCGAPSGYGVGGSGQVPLWGPIGGSPFGHPLPPYGLLAAHGLGPWPTQPQIAPPLAGFPGHFPRPLTPQLAYAG